MQIICTSLQTDKHVSTSPLSFYKTDALPAANQQCQSTEGTWILSTDIKGEYYDDKVAWWRNG